jgi:hypothetical protein
MPCSLLSRLLLNGFRHEAVTAIDRHVEAALWLAEQLSRPVDLDDENARVLAKEEIDELFESLSFGVVEECVEVYRILAWNEKEYRGKSLVIELVDAIKITYRLREEEIPTISLGSASMRVLDPSRSYRLHKVFISLVDDQNDDARTLSNITVHQDLHEGGSPLSGFNEENLELVIKAWAHLGGIMEELEGLPSYLASDG